MNTEQPDPLETVDSHTVAPDGHSQELQPQWRKEFPIDIAQDEFVARRDFVKFMVLTSFAFTIGQFWILVKSLLRSTAPFFPVVEIAKVNDIPVGGAKTFFYPEGSTPRLLVRMERQQFVAYDQLCTHLLCPVVPEFDERRFHCPCHNAWFDMQTGQVISGPPRRPLPRVVLEIRGDAVYAIGIEEPFS